MHCKSYSHFFSKKFQHIYVSLDVNFNESLSNDIVSFEQLGPDKYFSLFRHENMLCVFYMQTMKILIRLLDTQTDLSLHMMHMSEDTSTHVVAHVIFLLQYYQVRNRARRVTPDIIVTLKV